MTTTTELTPLLKRFKRYEKLNRELARRFPHDIDSYIEGKREFIENILSNPTG